MADTRSLTGLPHNVGAQFQAKFDGQCPVCTLAVYAGDLMGYVDDQAVCDGCYNDAETENWRTTRATVRQSMEEERAKDPEAYDRRQLAIKRMLAPEPKPDACPQCHLVRPCDCEPTAAENYSAMVRKQAELYPGKEWVPAPPGKTPGFIHVTPHLETPEEDLMAVEAGIQALMAAGLLQGQEPGGTGVCPAEIIGADGKVTEVAIPVPVLDLPGSERLEENRAKGHAPRKRASRAKATPEPVAAAEEVPPTDSVGDAAAAALARVRDAALQAEVVPFTAEENLARLAQLEANAAAVDIPAIMNPPAPTPDPSALQASLQAAVDAGTLTREVAESLGWTPSPWEEAEPVGAPVSKIAAAGPRTTEALEDFKANFGNPSADIFIDALAAATSAPEEDAILGALDNLAPYEGMPGGVEEAKKSIMAVIEDAITNHPRSLQKTIGPSEIGIECDHCLAAKLAGWEEQREGGAWLPTVGTAVHSWLEETFKAATFRDSDSPRYLTERKVAVGEIDGVEVTGSTDLVDLVRGMTWDWKVVGKTTLTSAKGGPSQRYKVQQMLYARGWRRLGVNITHVGIAYLPRNEMSLRSAVLWTAEYDEALAVAALERASQLARNVRAMAALGTETRDKYISGLDRWRSWRERDPVSGVEKLVRGNSQEGTIECRDCARYPDYPADVAGKQAKQLDGLMAPA